MDLSGLHILNCRWICSFCVIQQIGKVAYKLTLPQTLVGLHPLFHISNLKPYD